MLNWPHLLYLIDTKRTSERCYVTANIKRSISDNSSPGVSLLNMSTTGAFSTNVVGVGTLKIDFDAPLCQLYSVPVEASGSAKSKRSTNTIFRAQRAPV